MHRALSNMTGSLIVWGLLALGYAVSTIQLLHQGWDRPPRGLVLPFPRRESPRRATRRRLAPTGA